MEIILHQMRGFRQHDDRRSRSQFPVVTGNQMFLRGRVNDHLASP